jgi:hypothetical protein
MKQKLIGIVTLCLGILPALAQSGLYISPGTSIIIGAGTIFSTDSLVITPSADFTIAGQNALTRNATVIHSTANPYIQRVFHFSSTLPSYSGTISIYYRDPELNGIAENVLTLNVHNGTSWNAYNVNVTRDAVNDFVTTPGLSNISLNELTLASLSSPLPLNYILFNASCTGRNLKLSWKTAQEFNTKNFEIEKSSDGQHWQSIGTIAAAGYSSVEHSYSWNDNQAPGNSFYRIVEYDIDGRKNISPVLKSSCSPSESFAVYPNPVHNAAIININTNEMATIALRLYDAKGALVKQQQTNLLRGVNLLQLDMTALAAGSYNLIAQWNNTVKAVKIIKE